MCQTLSNTFLEISRKTPDFMFVLVVLMSQMIYPLTLWKKLSKPFGKVLKFTEKGSGNTFFKVI